jgi:hypothetical protein
MDVGKCWGHAFAEISNEAGTQSRSKGSNSRWPAKAMGRGAAGANIEQALISPDQDSIEVSMSDGIGCTVWRLYAQVASPRSRRSAVRAEPMDILSLLSAERPNAKQKIAQLDAEFRWRNDL